MDLKYRPPASIPNMDDYVKLNKILFMEDKNLAKCNPIEGSMIEILQMMFPGEVTDHKIPKRFKRLKPLIKRMILNHHQYEDKYSYIFESICLQSKIVNLRENYKLTISKSLIIKFILVCIYRVIPLEIFGSKLNRTTIFKKLLPKFLDKTNMNKMTRIDIEKVKTNDIKWMKSNDNLKMTKIQFDSGKKMVKKIIKWIFEQYICKLLAAFCHVTQPAKGNKILFFSNSIWNQITKRYKSKYYKDKLIKSHSDDNSLKSFDLNNDYVGKLSILPKPVGFRLIVRPFRGNRDEKMNYLRYRKNVIKPINSILRAIRGSQLLCESVDEVIKEIYNFKKATIGSNGPTFAIKFDIKEAYDSLSHEQIEGVLQKKLNEFTLNEKIYVQYYNVVELPDNKLSRRQKLRVVDQLEKLDPSNSTSKNLVVDKHETFEFTKKEILEIIRAQYSKTSFIKYNKQGRFTYTRKVGVFQGFPISGTLFNVIYDSVVDAIRQHIHMSCGDAYFKIVRLVDDFLILSREEKVCLEVKKLVCRDFTPFKVKINRQKTLMSKENMEFVGLKINLLNLTCSKDVNQYNLEPIRTLSTSRVLKMLMNYMDSRLMSSMDTLFKVDFNGNAVVKFNITSLIQAILWKLKNSLKMRLSAALHSGLLEEFLYQIYQRVKFVLNMRQFHKIVGHQLDESRDLGSLRHTIGPDLKQCIWRLRVRGREVKASGSEPDFHDESLGSIPSALS